MPFDNITYQETRHPLAATHERQIEILLDPDLSDEAKVRAFAEEVGFNGYATLVALDELNLSGSSPSQAVWLFGDESRSLFADLPGCLCPVLEVKHGRAAFPGVPWEMPDHPTREQLEAIARVQQEHR